MKRGHLKFKWFHKLYTKVDAVERKPTGDFLNNNIVNWENLNDLNVGQLPHRTYCSTL